jgi:hypothetical protein
LLGLNLEVVVLVVWLESLQQVSLLDVLPLMLNTGMGGVVVLSWRGGAVHSFPFVVLVLLQLERAGFLVVVFMEVALVGKVFWIVLTPLLSKWLGTGFYSSGTNPSAESFVHSLACFLISGGRLEEHLVD